GGGGPRAPGGARPARPAAAPACVEAAYLAARSEGDARFLPLVVDLANPSPAQGFAHEERSALTERFASGAVMALALVHHLAIGNNLPLPRIAEWLPRLRPALPLDVVPPAAPKA